MVIAALLRFYDLGRESLWFDEAFSVSVADWNPLWVILKLTEIGLRSTDRNIFNLLLHYALLLDRSEAMVRAIPAISGVLAVVALYALGGRLFGRAAGLLAAFLLAVSPMHVWYSREARGYALLALFGLLAAYFVLRALNDNRESSWLGYAVLSGCAVYTHSFGVLVITALNLFVLLHILVQKPPRRLVAQWLAATVLVGLMLIPFIRSFTGQATEGWGSWIADKYGVPTLKTLGFTMGLFSFNTAYDQNRIIYAAGLVVFAVPCLAAVAALARSLRRSALWPSTTRPLLFAFIYLAAPIAILYVASQVTPLYLERYLLPFVPPYLLIVSYGILALPRVQWRIFVMAALLLVITPALLAVYQPEQKEDWRGAAAYVSAGAGAGDLIVFYDAYMSIPFNYYYNWKTQELRISRHAPDDEMARHAAEIASARRQLWLVLSHVDEQRLISLLEAKPGMTRTGERSFLGLRVVAYAVNPPP